MYEIPPAETNKSDSVDFNTPYIKWWKQDKELPGEATEFPGNHGSFMLLIYEGGSDLLGSAA